MKNILQLIIFTCLMCGIGGVKGQTYFDMSTGNYSQNFNEITTLPTNFSTVAVLNTGSIPIATKTTTASSSALSVVGTSAAIGINATTSTRLVFLTTGSTDNSSAIAVDLNLNFTSRTAETLSYTASTIFNSTGNRVGSLKVYYSLDGTTWTELTGTNLPYAATNNVVGSGAVSISLPSALNNQATVKLRFYYHNGSGGSIGSRPKIGIDDLSVTSTASASASSSSNIIANTGFTYPTNIDYTAYQGTTLTTGNSLEVGQFTIQDGGGSADADALTTQLTALTLSVANSSGSRRIALFDGSTNVAEVTGSSSAAFTGLTLSAADDGSKTFSVRVSFLSSVTDNQQFSFTVNSATANSSGSTFAAANAGAAATSTTGDINRIEVATTDIIFDQNVSNVAENAVMSPSPTVRAVDDNVNFDLDNTSNVVLSVTTGSTTFGGSATTTVAMVAGVATFSNLVFAAAANSNNLTATQGSFTDVSSSFNVTASAPEINVKQNVTNLASGSGSHAAGSVVSGNSGSAITFTIENLGSANLTYSSITNSNTTDFTLDLSGTSTPIVPSGTTTFTVTFNPTTAGAKSTTITINNNDADEGTYTFTVTGTGTVSSESNIITNSGYTYTSNVNYAGFQTASTLTVGNSVGVHGLIIQDGAGSADADNLGTTLTAISFTTGGSTAIRTAALFDGTTNISEVSVNGATTISFSSLTLSATDGSTKNFELRVTYQATVTDNEQITFTVSSATSSSTTSGFAAANAGAAASTATSDINRLEVTADRLAWVQQPSAVITEANMSPSPTISANDANSNRDLDYYSTITLTSSASTISAGGSVAAISGLATFSGLQFSSTGTGVTLSGDDGSLTSTGNSSGFNVTVQAPGILLLEDNFTATNSALTSNNWAQSGSTSTNPITTGNGNGLTYTNYGSSNLGNAAIMTNTGQDVYRTFTQQNSPNTIYSSFLVSVSAAQSGDYIFAFADSTQTNYRARTFIKASANSGFINFGISNTGTTANYKSPPTDYALNTTHLVVVKYTFTSGSSATATVFINPNTSTEPSSGEVSFTDNTVGNVPAHIRSFTIRQGTSNLAPTLVLDGIRIATNWGALMGNPQYTSSTDIAEGNYNNINVISGALTATGNVSVNGTTANNGVIAIGANTLTVNGAVSGSGTFTGGSSSNLTITGTSGTINFDQTTPGITNVLKNLTLSGSGTTTLGNALNITGGATPGVITFGSGATATLATGGNLTLASDANGTAVVIGGTNSDITGNVTVQRYLPWSGANHNGFRFVGHPLRTNPALNTVINLPSASNTVIDYNNASNSYAAVSDRTTTWPQATGYGVWTNDSNTLVFNGELQLSAVPAVSMGTATNRWNYVSNPFPSVMDWHEVTKTNLEETIYRWDKSTATLSAGSNVAAGTWGTYVQSTQVSANGGSRYMAPMQGFMVQASSGASSASLAYPSSARVDQSATYVRQQQTAEVARASVTHTASGFGLETVLCFLPQATTAYDPDLEARYLSGGVSASQDLYTQDAQGQTYSIQSLPELSFQNTTRIPLHLAHTQAGAAYTWNMDLSGLSSGHTSWLEDTRLGTLTPVVSGQPLTFTAQAGDAVDRFHWVFAAQGTAVQALESAEKVTAHLSDGRLILRGLRQAPATLHWMDLSGRLLSTQTLNDPDATYDSPANLLEGTYYLLRVQSPQGQYHYRLRR